MPGEFLNLCIANSIGPLFFLCDPSLSINNVTLEKNVCVANRGNIFRAQARIASLASSHCASLEEGET